MQSVPNMVAFAALVMHSAVALAGDAIELRMAARPGEVYEQSVRTNSKINLERSGETVFQLLIGLDLSVERHVQSVSGDGVATLSERNRRVRTIVDASDRGIARFDSADPAIAAAAQRDPGVARRLAMIRINAELQQDDTGAIRDYRLVPPPSLNEAEREQLEEDALKRVFLLPERRVSIGDSWEVGTQTTLFQGIGTLTRQLTGTLQGLRTESGERLAQVSTSGAIVKFTPDQESRAKGAVTRFEEKGIAVFSITRGRLLSWHFEGKLDLAPASGGFVTHMLYRSDFRENKR